MRLNLSSFTLFRYEKRVKWALLRVLQFWKTIYRFVVEGEECGSHQEMCGWIFVNLAFCWAVGGWGGGGCDDGGHLR